MWYFFWNWLFDSLDEPNSPQEGVGADITGETEADLVHAAEGGEESEFGLGSDNDCCHDDWDNDCDNDDDDFGCFGF